ncbi:hypothetical protein D3C73_625800 [compost metagenome]
MLDQVAPVEQALDDRGASGFGADAGGVLELLLEYRVLHQFGDVLHRLDQVAFGKGFGWLGPEVLELHIGHRTFAPFAESGQGLWHRCLAAPGRGEGLRQGAFPARFDDLLADGAQGLAGAVEVGLGAVELMNGQELREVACADQGINRALLAGEPFKIFCCRGRNDAVVGADFCVVPRP